MSSPLLLLPAASALCRSLEHDPGSCAAISVVMMISTGCEAAGAVLAEARAVLETASANVPATVLAIVRGFPFLFFFSPAAPFRCAAPAGPTLLLSARAWPVI